MINFVSFLTCVTHFSNKWTFVRHSPITNDLKYTFLITNILVLLLIDTFNFYFKYIILQPREIKWAYKYLLYYFLWDK